LLGSRRRAALAGPLLHALLDVVPHEDIESRRFEIGSAFGLLALFAATRGPLDPAVIGAIASSAPDLETCSRCLVPAAGSSFRPTVGVAAPGLRRSELGSARGRGGDHKRAQT
jgi:hypothetical protein